MVSDTDPFTETFTRRQWHEIKKALQTRRKYLKHGLRLGTADSSDVMMVEALIDAVNRMLAEAASG